MIKEIEFTGRQLGLIHIMARNLRKMAPDMMKEDPGDFDEEMIEDLDAIIEKSEFIMEMAGK